MVIWLFLSGDLSSRDAVFFSILFPKALGNFLFKKIQRNIKYLLCKNSDKSENSEGKMFFCCCFFHTTQSAVIYRCLILCVCVSQWCGAAISAALSGPDYPQIFELKCRSEERSAKPSVLLGTLVDYSN